MATSCPACLAEPDQRIVPCVKWLEWVVDSEFTRLHMAAERLWSCSGVLAGTGRAASNERLLFLSFSGKKTFVSPVPTAAVALPVLLSALFLCDDSRPENMLRSLISNPAKPTSHTRMHPTSPSHPPPRSLSLQRHSLSSFRRSQIILFSCRGIKNHHVALLL